MGRQKRNGGKKASTKEELDVAGDEVAYRLGALRDTSWSLLGRVLAQGLPVLATFPPLASALSLHSLTQREETRSPCCLAPRLPASLCFEVPLSDRSRVCEKWGLSSRKLCTAIILCRTLFSSFFFWWASSPLAHLSYSLRLTHLPMDPFLHHLLLVLPAIKLLAVMLSAPQLWDRRHRAHRQHGLLPRYSQHRQPLGSLLHVPSRHPRSASHRTSIPRMWTSRTRIGPLAFAS